jgi:protein-S-isoprenylcysteine O-methyltransferase Ste14
MFILLFLHILMMFTAVAVAGGTNILLLVGARRSDRALVAAITSLPIPRAAPILYITGGLFGLATALSFGFNLLAPWLIIAYVLFAMLAGFGILYSGPIFARVHAVASDAQAGAEAFRKVMRQYRVDAVLSLAGIGLLLADMVFKPFS